MRLFWHKGYSDTSMRDIVEHTGVAHAGIYAAFGDKRRLYRAALEHYDATHGSLLIGPLEASDAGRAAIDTFFATVVTRAKNGEFDDGCFMCNTAVELANIDDGLAAAARARSTAPRPSTRCRPTWSPASSGAIPAPSRSRTSTGPTIC